MAFPFNAAFTFLSKTIECIRLENTIPGLPPTLINSYLSLSWARTMERSATQYCVGGLTQVWKLYHRPRWGVY